MRKHIRQVRTRALRQLGTDAERLLWRYLRNRNLCGFKFRRQVPLGNYIADFVCMERRLVVELGRQHLEAAKRDAARPVHLERSGFCVLRFWNDQVLKETEAVLNAIHLALSSPHPNPLPASGRGG